MKHSPDFDFLHSLAERRQDHEILEGIQNDRQEILARRYEGMRESRSPSRETRELLPPLTLSGITLELPRDIAPACADILTEHLRDKAHAAAPGFDGADAGLVVDIGANIGMYTLARAAQNPSVEVVAAEPVVATFRTLVGNLALNNLRLVTAVRAAVGNPAPAPFLHSPDRPPCRETRPPHRETPPPHRETRSLRQAIRPAHPERGRARRHNAGPAQNNPRPSQHNPRLRRNNGYLYSGTISIEVAEAVPSVASRSLRSAGPRWLRHLPVTRETVCELRTAELLSLCGNKRISILKIDVEGDEIAVLRGAAPVLSRVERVVVEYHGRRRREYCRQLLEGFGFRLVAADSGPVGDLYFA